MSTFRFSGPLACSALPLPGGGEGEKGGGKPRKT